MNTGQPGSYKIKKFLIHDSVGKRDDISALVPELYIKESMNNDSIRGHAYVLDKGSLLENWPLRGEERITLEVEDADGTAVTYDLFLYKIDNVQVLPSNDGLTYLIHFCSFGRFVAGLGRVCKAYNDYISVMVEDIFQTYWSIPGNGFEVTVPDYGHLQRVSATSSMQSIAIPNMTPIQAMDFLARRSYSDEWRSSSYRFFENMRGFHFANDEDLYLQVTDPLTFTFSDAIPKGGASFHLLRRNFITFDNTRRVNTIDDINSGAYRHDIVQIDLTNRTVDEHRFSYIEDKNRWNRPGGIVANDIHTDEFINGTFVDTAARKMMYFITNTSPVPGSLAPDTHLSEIISNRMSYRYHMSKIQSTATIHGRLDLTAGDIIEVVMPEMIPDTAATTMNPMGGKYLVVEVNRSFVRENYNDQLILMKADWEEPRSINQVASVEV